MAMRGTMPCRRDRATELFRHEKHETHESERRLFRTPSSRSRKNGIDIPFRRVFKPFDPEPVNHECSAYRLRYIERSA
jgi:hypothetical protein